MRRRKQNFQQGWYAPRHPEKYKGDATKIRYMSSWELKFHQFLDNNPSILEWSSEEITIPYIKPTDGKVHRYYPDYWVKYRNKHGHLVQEIIEVKPEKQTRTPTTRGKRKIQQLHESVTYAINIAKWRAAQNFCRKYGMTFRIVTENQLFR